MAPLIANQGNVMTRVQKSQVVNWLYRGVRDEDLRAEFGEDVYEQIRSIVDDPKVGHLYNIEELNTLIEKSKNR